MAAVAETVPAAPLFEEKEKDAGKITSKKGLSPAFGLNAYDSTINALVSPDDSLLSCANTDGLQLLLAYTKANYGVKKGRFYFEFQIVEATAKSEFRVGVSTASAQFVGGKQSIAFDNLGGLRANGEETKKVAQKPLLKKDIIGVLLNMDAKTENKNTLSLFINGERVCEPQAIPESMLKEALFPHFAVRGCTLGFNFTNIRKPLPFSVHMIASAAPTEVQATSVKKIDTPKAVFPIGTNVDEYVEKFLTKEKESYLALTKSHLDEWIVESGLQERNDAGFGLQIFDNIKILAPWLRAQPRNIIYNLGNGTMLFPEHRMKLVSDLVGYECRAHVVSISEKSKMVFAKNAEACLPSEAEGFATITQEAKINHEEHLEAWKKDQKLRSKVNDLKVGTYWQERSKEWTAFVTEKKTTEEGKLFSDEDWMLAQIRADLVHIIHAFKEDVADEERPSFPATLLAHYYRTYCPKNLFLNHYAVETVEELLKQYLGTAVTIGEDGLLQTDLPSDFAFDTIFEQVDLMRERRETRVGAGDELSALKFSAKNPPREGNQWRGSKGNGGKGRDLKRRMAPTNSPPAQRQRV